MCDRPWIKWSEFLQRVQGASEYVTMLRFTCVSYHVTYIRQTVIARGSRHKSKILPSVQQPNFSPKNLQGQQLLLPGDSEEMHGSTSHVKGEKM